MLKRAQLLRWPTAAAERDALLHDRQPCVWLVEIGAAPPTDWGHLEDWVRMPADEQELAARVSLVERRAEAVADHPWIDDECLLRRGNVWVALTQLEVRLLRPLLEHVRTVVRRDELARAAWPDDESGGERNLATPIKTLRRKIAPLDISIHTISGRGYLVEVSRPSRQTSVPSTPTRTA